MLAKISNWLAAFLELQLVIFLLSLPIIIHWGLAVSCMLPLANIIFTPLLTCFLWCSCVFACCSILKIPTDWINLILHQITVIWYYLLSFATPSWLIGFNYQTIWLAILIGLAVILFYIFLKPTRSQALIFLTFCTFTIFATKIPLKNYRYYKFDNIHMAGLIIHNKVYLLDNGGLCCKQNFYSWIDYTILPTLIKKAGITTIHTLILYKPHKKLIPIVEQFAQQTNLKRIFVTTKQNCFEQFLYHFKNKNIEILPIPK